MSTLLDPVELDAARRHARRVVAAASLRPAALPPAAVLCVRRLGDPLRETLRLEPATLRPPPAWEHAAAEAVARAARSAARPALGAVPAGAEAVLFADRAELLAVLARDQLAHQLAGRWWWQALLRAGAGAAPATAVSDAWLATPQDVPAALELLARWSLATAFADALEPEVALELARVVVTAHGAGPMKPISVVEKDNELPGLPAVERPPAPREALRRPAAVVARKQTPPWRDVVAEASAPALRPEAVFFLGVTLTVRRAPTWARAPAFVAAAERWLAAARRAVVSGERPAPVEGVGLIAEPAPRSRVAGESQSAAAPGEDAVRPAPPVRQAAPRGAGAAAEHAAPADVASQAPPADSTDPVATQPRVMAPPTLTASARPDAAPVPPPAVAQRVDFDAPVAQITATALGGLFYLLNLALFLELYGDFTRPRDRGLRLDPWDLLSLLGRELLGQRYYRDPVWGLLARLAGRPVSSRPGASFTPPKNWRLPPEWLAPFADVEEPWSWSGAAGRLRIRHPAGFLVLDVPLGRDSRLQLSRALRAYGHPACVRAAIDERAGTRRERWVGRLAAYVEARLALALGVRKAVVGRTLLVQPARVIATSARLDVVVPIESLPVAVRLAGLDRDPGWVPAAGYDVRFHFE